MEKKENASVTLSRREHNMKRKTELTDKRLNWEYRNCKIFPVACYRNVTRGKNAEPIDFGSGPRTQYWRIEFPHMTWVHVDTKAECRICIDTAITMMQVEMDDVVR